jgi:hypothetical protein
MPNGRNRVITPRTFAYVRGNPKTKRVSYRISSTERLVVCPFMAREIAHALLRAADRLDPAGVAPAPWGGEG